jgi:hypothetical protein
MASGLVLFLEEDVLGSGFERSPLVQIRASRATTLDQGCLDHSPVFEAIYTQFNGET